MCIANIKQRLHIKAAQSHANEAIIISCLSLILPPLLANDLRKIIPNRRERAAGNKKEI